jgi:hypothetical protein
MKKYETLAKMLANTDENALAEMLANIAQNEALIVDALTAKQKMHLLQFAELEKALKNAKYTLVLDCNFENSKAQTAQTHIYSLLDTANKRVLHIYSHDKTLDIVFSSNSATLEKVAFADKLTSDFTVKHKRDSKTQRVKETKLASVAFDSMINAIKFALLILETSVADLQAMLEKQ